MKHTFPFWMLIVLGLLTACDKGSRQGFVANQGEPIYLQCDTTHAEPVVKTALEMLAHDFDAVLDADLRIVAALDSNAAQGHAIVMGDEALDGWDLDFESGFPDVGQIPSAGVSKCGDFIDIYAQSGHDKSN